MRGRRSGAPSKPGPGVPAPVQWTVRAATVERWSATLCAVAGGAVDHGRLRAPRRWPGPRVDLTPSDTVDAAAVRMLLAGRHVRLSQLVVPAAVPEASRRMRSVERVGRAVRERHGLDLVRIVLGTFTWSPDPGDADPAEQGGADDVGAPILPALVAPVDLTLRGDDDLDLVVRGSWELAPAVIDRLAEAGVEVDPLAVLGPEGGGRAALDRLAEAGAALADFRVNQRVLVGLLPVLGRTALDDLRQLVDTLAEPVETRSGDPFELVAALAGDPDAIATVRRTCEPPGPTDPAGVPGSRTESSESDHPLVLDADAGQRAVLDAVVRGGPVVITAPSGTGAARTVANLAATLMSRGRSVLVVGDPAATLRRPADLLEQAGLGDLVCGLARAGPPETIATRRRLIERLISRVDAWSGSDVRPADSDQTRLAELAGLLARHHHALHDRREPWGVSAHEVIGELLELDRDARGSAPSDGSDSGSSVDLAAVDLPAVDLPAVDIAAVELPRRVVADISRRDLDAIAGELHEWARRGGAALAAGEGVWAGSVGLITDVDQVTQVRALLGRIDEALVTVRHELDPLIAALGLPLPRTIRAAEEVLAVSADLERLLGRYRPELLTVEVPLEQALDARTNRWRGRRAARRARRASSVVLDALRRDGARSPAEDALDDLRALRRVRAAWSELAPGRPLPIRVPSTAAARRAASSLGEGLSSLAGFVPTVATARSTAAFHELSAQLEVLTAASASLALLPRIDELRHHLAARELTPVLDEVSSRRLDPDAAVQLLRRSWLRGVLTELQLVDDVLGSAVGSEVDAAADELLTVERRRRSRHPMRIRSEVASRAAMSAAAQSGALETLRSSAGGTAGPTPTVRSALADVAAPILAAVPCWFVSPHLVPEVLPWPTVGSDGAALFDVVLILGAEQMPVAAAIPALLRGRQVVVFGDARRASSGPDDCVLTAMTDLLPDSRHHSLQWFHRNGDGRLAALAETVAGGDPTSVLAVPTPVSDAPVRLVVPGTPSDPTDGVRSERSPDTEPVMGHAAAIVDLIVEHAVRHRSWSLGVVVTTEEQAERISTLLSAGRTDDRILDRLLTETSVEPLIVRTLEGLAGELRDHLILSLDSGALAATRDEADLVGAVSAARHLLTVALADEPATDADHRPVDAMARLLHAASSGSVAEARGVIIRPDPVLVDVAERLRERGVPVELVPGRVPELTLQHPAEPGRPVLAVLGDRPAHEVLLAVTDRECLLPEHMSRLGWRWHRLRTLDWLRDPQIELDRLLDTWQRLS